VIEAADQPGEDQRAIGIDTPEAYSLAERAATVHAPPGAPVDDPEVAAFALGGGWYDLPGVGKVQGRDAAEEAWAARPR
jgi:hypothetical protein